MFTHVTANGIQPTGPIVYTGTTAGATWRYRDGQPIEIRQGPFGFNVFIAGRFDCGMRTVEQAIDRAGRY